MVRDALLHALAWVTTCPAPGRDEDGQTLAEYGLITGIIVVAVIATAVGVFRDAIAWRLEAAADCLSQVTC